MKLGRQMDYHGSRAYAPDLPSSAEGNWVTRLAAWAKQKLELLLRPSAEQAAATIWLAHGEERHFSVLGSEGDKKRRRAAASPWPVSENEVRARRPAADR